MQYILIAKVNQIVEKRIKLEISADSEEDAEDKARRALAVFPEKIEEEGISRIQVLKQQHYIPRDIDFVKTKQEDEVA